MLVVPINPVDCEHGTYQIIIEPKTKKIDLRLNGDRVASYDGFVYLNTISCEIVHFNPATYMHNGCSVAEISNEFHKFPQIQEYQDIFSIWVSVLSEKIVDMYSAGMYNNYIE